MFGNWSTIRSPVLNPMTSTPLTRHLMFTGRVTSPSRCIFPYPWQRWCLSVPPHWQVALQLAHGHRTVWVAMDEVATPEGLFAVAEEEFDIRADDIVLCTVDTVDIDMRALFIHDIKEGQTL